MPANNKLPLIRHNSPNAAGRVVYNAILLQVGPSPSQTVFHLSPIAVLRIVRHVQYFVWQIQAGYYSLIYFIDGTGTTQAVKGFQQWVHQLMMLWNRVLLQELVSKHNFMSQHV